MAGEGAWWLQRRLRQRRPPQQLLLLRRRWRRPKQWTQRRRQRRGYCERAGACLSASIGAVPDTSVAAFESVGARSESADSSPQARVPDQSLPAPDPNPLARDPSLSAPYPTPPAPETTRSRGAGRAGAVAGLVPGLGPVAARAALGNACHSQEPRSRGEPGDVRHGPSRPSRRGGKSVPPDLFVSTQIVSASKSCQADRVQSLGTSGAQRPRSLTPCRPSRRGARPVRPQIRPVPRKRL